MDDDLLKRAMKEIGRRGGKARAKNLTPAERSKIARKAAKASSKVRTQKARLRAASKKKSS
jgi:hypothetical protein